MEGCWFLNVLVLIRGFYHTSSPIALQEFESEQPALELRFCVAANSVSGMILKFFENSESRWSMIFGIHHTEVKMALVRRGLMEFRLCQSARRIWIPKYKGKIFLFNFDNPQEYPAIS